MVVLRSLLFFLGQTLSTVVIAAAVPLVWPLPDSLRYRYIVQWSRFNLWWLRVTCGITVRVEGRENIPDGVGVVLAKHQSAWETLAMQWIFPPQTWVLKRSLLWIPFFGWGLALTRPIAIDREAGKQALRQVIEQGRERLQRGLWVVVFPEGTRVAPGEKGRYAVGGAMLAVGAGVPAIPVAHNAGSFWPRNGFLKHPGTITLVVGRPVDTRNRKAGEVIQEVEEWIESKMVELDRSQRES